VSINGKDYSHEELEQKIKTRTETAILNTLKEIMEDEEIDVTQLEVDFEYFPSILGNGGNE